MNKFMDNNTLKSYIDNIDNHLSYLLSIAQKMQDEVQISEGDSDLYRKLAFYLSPNINQWINGAQAGGVKDLKELLDRREKQKINSPQPASDGDGHEVLTNSP